MRKMTEFLVMNIKNYQNKYIITRNTSTIASRYYVTKNYVKVVALMNRATVPRNLRSVSENIALRERQ
jgi:hypothetical protein